MSREIGAAAPAFRANCADRESRARRLRKMRAGWRFDARPARRAGSRQGEEWMSTDGVSRRRFLGYVIAAPVVVAAADLRAQPAEAAIPTVQPVDLFDLSDLLTDAALVTASFITVTVNPDGTVSFALPRAEVGQGITTSIAMVIAEEMDLPLGKVHMTLSDARPELVWNQITGGSNSVHSLYNQVRVAAAIAKGQLTRGAGEELEAPLPQLKVKGGLIVGPD